MLDVLRRSTAASEPATCKCDIDPAKRQLVVTQCSGSIIKSPGCRASLIDGIGGNEMDPFHVVDGGEQRIYDGAGVKLFAAAHRAIQRIEPHDEQLAAQLRQDPLRVAPIVAGRSPPIGPIADQTGLAEAAAGYRSYDELLEPVTRPVFGACYIQPTPPAMGSQRERILLDTGTAARVYDRDSVDVATYHVEPLEYGLSPKLLDDITTAIEWLADREHQQANAMTAVQSVLEPAALPDEITLGQLAAVIEKHTTGYGILEDLFGDPQVSDVYAPSGATDDRLWIVRNGEHLQTNVRVDDDGVEVLASRMRRETGEPFSRATPTVDASTTIQGKQVRIAGITDPATEGTGFAFRTGGTEPFTLPGLVANGTVPARAAGLLSMAVRRNASVLIGGIRGAGKTTLLGSLLFELPGEVRILPIEDTPELPVDTLQTTGRNVQPVTTTRSEGPGISPTEALRTGLRLGNSAIVLGEVRGEEASVLYEAMRVGASGETVLGTIHGDGGVDIAERVTEDLGVPESSFAVTDLVVTVEAYSQDDGTTGRRIKTIEEVIGQDEVRFEPLYCQSASGLTSTGRLERGNSVVLESLSSSGEAYADLLSRIADRGQLLLGLAERNETEPTAVTKAYAQWDGHE